MTFTDKWIELESSELREINITYLSFVDISFEILAMNVSFGILIVRKLVRAIEEGL